MDHLDSRTDLNIIQVEPGFTLSVNKPLGWTSFDVVNKIRFHLKFHWKQKKIKVGHAGTLDPLADGLLIIGVGKGTKCLENWMGQEKVYSGVMKLGVKTPSYDRESNEYDPKSIINIFHDDLINCSQSFLGTIKQYPPIFSALKKDGVPLYKIARRGDHVDLPARNVVVHNFEIIKWDSPYLTFRVRCGKGTYIRSLANDFGEKMGTGAYLYSLKREKIGHHHIDEAFEIDALISALSLVKSPKITTS